jgi:hypothetical protein
MINVDNEDLPQKRSGMDPGIFVVDNFLTEEEEATILSLMSTGTPDTGKTLSFKLSPAPHFLMWVADRSVCSPSLPVALWSSDQPHSMCQVMIKVVVLLGPLIKTPEHRLLSCLSELLSRTLLRCPALFLGFRDTLATLFAHNTLLGGFLQVNSRTFGRRDWWFRNVTAIEFTQCGNGWSIARFCSSSRAMISLKVT